MRVGGRTPPQITHSAESNEILSKSSRKGRREGELKLNKSIMVSHFGTRFAKQFTHVPLVWFIWCSCLLYLILLWVGCVDFNGFSLMIRLIIQSSSSYAARTCTVKWKNVSSPRVSEWVDVQRRRRRTGSRLGTGEKDSRQIWKYVYPVYPPTTYTTERNNIFHPSPLCRLAIVCPCKEWHSAPA